MSELQEIVLIKKISQTARYLLKLMNDELTDSQDQNFIKLMEEEIIFYKNKLKEVFNLFEIENNKNKLF